MAAVSKEAKERHERLHNELRQWYKEHGLCPRCKEPSEPGRVYCKSCMAVIRARQDMRDPGHEKRNAYSRERRAKLKAAGMCTYCGKNKAVDGQVLCPKCKKKNAESQLLYNIRRRMKREAENERRMLLERQHARP